MTVTTPGRAGSEARRRSTHRRMVTPVTGSLMRGCDIDTLADRVSLQSPANVGTLAPTGNLGVNAGPDAGFDIYFSPKCGTDQGFAALNTAGAARLYAVDVLTGAARDLGAFPQRRQVTDLALPLDQQR